MNLKVSVIIPVYKVEKYLERCLDSIERQTYDNLEVVLVDDGSPDNSGKMCDKYAESHDNVIVIHQENQGLSVARNNGAKVSTGEFITFVDSDDYVSDDYVEHLYSILIENEADISASGIKAFYGEKYNPIWKETDEVKVHTVEEALSSLGYGIPFGTSACAKLYKRELVLDHPFTVGKLYEEIDTTYKIIADERVKKVVSTSKIIYYYYQSEESISTGKLDDKKMYGLTAAQNYHKFLQDNYPKAESGGKFRCALVIVEFIPFLFDGTDENRLLFSKLKKELRKYSKDVIHDNRAWSSVKLRCGMVMCGYNVSRILFKFYFWLKDRRYR